MAGEEQGELKHSIRICAILVCLSLQQIIIFFTVQMAKQCLGKRLTAFVGYMKENDLSLRLACNL